MNFIEIVKIIKEEEENNPSSIVKTFSRESRDMEFTNIKNYLEYYRSYYNSQLNEIGREIVSEEFEEDILAHDWEIL